MIRVRQVARNLQKGEAVLGVWGRNRQRSKILNFFCKTNLILGPF